MTMIQLQRGEKKQTEKCRALLPPSELLEQTSLPQILPLFFPLPLSNINVLSHGMVQIRMFHPSDFHPPVLKTTRDGCSLQERILTMPLQMFLLWFQASPHKNTVCQIKMTLSPRFHGDALPVLLKMAAVNQ